MKYDLKKPCSTCPFVVAHNFPLEPERIEEIRNNRGEFPCHNTVDFDAEVTDDEDYDGIASPWRNTSCEQHCVGHLIVCWADWHGFNQIQAISARMGAFDPKSLPTPGQAGTFATWDDMIQEAEDRGW